MRRLILSALMILTICPAIAAQAADDKATSSTEALVDVSVDPRIELVSVVFRLAGNPEYGQCKIPSYSKALREWFDPYRDHALVNLAAQLCRKHGVSYDAPMGLAVRLPDMRLWEKASPIQIDPTGLDQRWKKDDIRAFLDLLPRFARDSHFAEFMESQKTLIRATEQRAREQVGKSRLDWIVKFFGIQTPDRFHMFLGLVNGPSSYGASTQSSSGKAVYSICGVWQLDAEGLPVFDENLGQLAAHEFGHTYVNPLVYKHLDEFEPAGKKLFARVKDRMTQQAYGDWSTMMHESIDRAVGIRYAYAIMSKQAGEKAAAYEKSRGFLWVPALAVLLEQYEADRAQYPTIESFLPRIVRFFNEDSLKTVAILDNAPKVVRTVPADGATNVDPGLTEISVTFDRDMDTGGSWAWTGSQETFPPGPEGSKPFWRDTRTCVQSVRLQPGRNYRFGINGPGFEGFRGKDGAPAEAATVSFSTR